MTRNPKLAMIEWVTSSDAKHGGGNVSKRRPEPTPRLVGTIRIVAGVLVLLLGSMGCQQNSRGRLLLPGVVETQEVRISSKVGGRIESVLAKEGDLVKARDPLVKIEVAELTAKRMQWLAQQDALEAKFEMLQNGPLPEQIAAARAGMEVAEVRLARLQAGWRTEEVEIARFESETRQAEYDRARAELGRMSPLKASNSISQSDFDATNAAMLTAQAQARSSAKRLEMMIKGVRAEDIAEAQAELAKMRADYELIKRGTRAEELRQAKAHVDEMIARVAEIDVLINECTVTAPEDCLVEIIAVRHGDVVAPNQPIMRVLYKNDLWVKAYVPETELSRVRLNQRVTVTHDGTKESFAGEIVHIANVSEFTPRNVQSVDERHHQVFAIKVRLEDGVGVFKSGMAAQVTIPKGE